MKTDTIVSWDRWAHDEENPDHYVLARGIEAAIGWPGALLTTGTVCIGLQPHTVADKYYFARCPEITRVVDISQQIGQKVEANRANSGKGPVGHLGSRLVLSWPKTANSFNCSETATVLRPIAITSRNLECGTIVSLVSEMVSSTQKLSTIWISGAGAGTDPTIEAYVKEHAVSLK